MKIEERHIHYDERIDRYMRGMMDEQEKATFEQEVDSDQELRERLVATAMLATGIASEGMRQEGQAQLDAIKRMSRDEFITATQGNDGEKDEKKGTPRKPMFPLFMRWATGIAAAALVAIGFYALRPSTETSLEEEITTENVDIKNTKTVKPAKPTLASIADEYNKSFDSEPEEFKSIRQQIKRGRRTDMAALVHNIDNIPWPTAKHADKGADDGDEIIMTTGNYSDCTHWYKALAYLKMGDKDSAITELNALKEHGSNDELMKRAASLLKRLGQQH